MLYRCSPLILTPFYTRDGFIVPEDYKLVHESKNSLLQDIADDTLLVNKEGVVLVSIPSFCSATPFKFLSCFDLNCDNTTALTLDCPPALVAGTVPLDGTGNIYPSYTVFLDTNIPASGELFVENPAGSGTFVSSGAVGGIKDPDGAGTRFILNFASCTPVPEAGVKYKFKACNNCCTCPPPFNENCGQAEDCQECVFTVKPCPANGLPSQYTIQWDRNDAYEIPNAVPPRLCLSPEVLTGSFTNTDMTLEMEAGDVMRLFWDDTTVKLCGDWRIDRSFTSNCESLFVDKLATKKQPSDAATFPNYSYINIDAAKVNTVTGCHLYLVNKKTCGSTVLIDIDIKPKGCNTASPTSLGFPSIAGTNTSGTQKWLDCVTTNLPSQPVLNLSDINDSLTYYTCPVRLVNWQVCEYDPTGVNSCGAVIETSTRTLSISINSTNTGYIAGRQYLVRAFYPDENGMEIPVCGKSCFFKVSGTLPQQNLTAKHSITPVVSGSPIGGTVGGTPNLSGRIRVNQCTEVTNIQLFANGVPVKPDSFEVVTSAGVLWFGGAFPPSFSTEMQLDMRALTQPIQLITPREFKLRLTRAGEVLEIPMTISCEEIFVLPCARCSTAP